MKKCYGTVKFFLLFLGLGLFLTYGLIGTGKHNSLQEILGWLTVLIIWVGCIGSAVTLFKPPLQYDEKGIITLRSGRIYWNSIVRFVPDRLENGFYIGFFDKNNVRRFFRASPFALKNVDQAKIDIARLLKKHNPKAEVSPYFLKKKKSFLGRLSKRVLGKS